MLSSLVGVVIMSVATVSLLVATRIGDEAIRSAGKHSLTKHEITIIRHAGWNSKDNLDNLNDEVKTLFE